MVDILDTLPKEVATTAIPRAPLSAGDVAQPWQEMSRAADQLGTALGDVAIPLAKRQAAQDINSGAASKVTRAPDGSVQIATPENAPLIFGEAGKAYEAAVVQGTAAKASNMISQDFTEGHAKFPLDPAGYKAWATAHLQEIAKQQGNTPLGQEILRQGGDLLTQHLNGITNATASNDIENSKKSILANIDDKKNALQAFAATPGGTESPKYAQTLAEYDALHNGLANNPLFKMPADQIALERKEFVGTLRGEALVGHIDDTVQKTNKAEAQKQLGQLLQDPDIPREEAMRLYRQGMSHLELATNEQRADYKAAKEGLDQVIKGFAEGKLDPSDPKIAQLAKQAFAAGNPDVAYQLQSVVAAHNGHLTLDGLPAAARAQATDGLSPVSGFDASVSQVMRMEGGYTVDNGGPTRFGVSQRGNPDVNAATLTPGDAKEIYRSRYWNAIGGDQLPSNMQFVALYGAAASGPGKAKEWIAQAGGDPNKFLDIQDAFQRRLIANDPTSYARYAQSWQNRIAEERRMVNGGAVPPGPQGGSNPHDLPEYFRALAESKDTRANAFGAASDAALQALKLGNPITPDAMTLIAQTAATGTPEQKAKAAEIYGQQQAQMALATGGKDRVIPSGGDRAPSPMSDAQRDVAAQQWMAGAAKATDLLTQRMLQSAAEYAKTQDKRFQEAPMAEGARRFSLAPPNPIDPAQPSDVAGNVAYRGVLAQHIGELNGTAKPGLLDKDEGSSLRAVLTGQAGAQVLGQIATAVRPQDMDALAREPAFKESVVGMSKSDDPAKRRSAFGFMNTLANRDVQTFKAAFGEEGIKDLSAWQGLTSMMTDDAATKRMMQYNDPSTVGARDALEKVATKALESVTAAQVVSKFSTGLWPFGTTAQAPVNTADAVNASAVLHSEYNRVYRDVFAQTADTASADTAAMNVLKTKFAVSPSNGNRVMANAPETHYPEVAGSHDWISHQLDDIVAAHVGKSPSELPAALGLAGAGGPMGETALGSTDADDRYKTPRSLLSDKTTEADLAAGKPPSYQVALQDPNGRWSALTEPSGAATRVRFDPAQYQTDLAAKMERIAPFARALAATHPQGF